MARKYLDNAPSRERILNDINSYKTRWETSIDENGNSFEIPTLYRDTSVKTVPWNTNRQTRKRNTKPIVKKQKSTRYKSDRKTIYTPSSSSEGTTYEVQRGDTLGSILRRHGISTDAKTINRIAKENGIADANKIYVGQKLNLGKTVSDKDKIKGKDTDKTKDVSKGVDKDAGTTKDVSKDVSKEVSKDKSSSVVSKDSVSISKYTPAIVKPDTISRDTISRDTIPRDSVSRDSIPSYTVSPDKKADLSKSYAGRDFLAKYKSYERFTPSLKEAASVKNGDWMDESIRRIFAVNSINPALLYAKTTNQNKSESSIKDTSKDVAERDTIRRDSIPSNIVLNDSIINNSVLNDTIRSNANPTLNTAKPKDFRNLPFYTPHSIDYKTINIMLKNGYIDDNFNVTEKFTNAVNNGSIDRKFANNIVNDIEDVVADVANSYSKFGTPRNQTFSEGLRTNLDYNLRNYNTVAVGPRGEQGLGLSYPELIVLPAGGKGLSFIRRALSLTNLRNAKDYMISNGRLNRAAEYSHGRDRYSTAIVRPVEGKTPKGQIAAFTAPNNNVNPNTPYVYFTKPNKTSMNYTQRFGANTPKGKANVGRYYQRTGMRHHALGGIVPIR